MLFSVSSRFFLALAAAATPLGGHAEPAGRQPVEAPTELLVAVTTAERAGKEARRACGNDEGALETRILAGTAEPEDEAATAAMRGCFNLITSFGTIPGGLQYAVGVACRPNWRLFAYGNLSRFSFAGSDVGPRTAEEARTRERSLDALGTFALAYNRAVIGRSDFPHRDLCRVAADDYRPTADDATPGAWGYRMRDETDAPIDIYEAARRGTTASMRRLIAANPIQLHVPDLLGITPLGWAIIYDRLDQARLLVEAGAHPHGDPSDWTRQVFSTDHYVMDEAPIMPILIAVEERKRAMTRLMRPALGAAGLPVPPAGPRLDRARSSPDMFGIDPMREYAAATVLISAEGRVTDCTFQNAVADSETACDRARRGPFYEPAEDGESRAQRSSAFIYLPVNRRR